MNKKLRVLVALSSLVLFAIMVAVPAKASIISFTSTINGAQANAGAGSGSFALARHRCFLMT
jgi:hypothetical protein